MVLTIYNKKTLENSWKDGSTVWIVSGKDGIRFFSREDFVSIEELFEALKKYIEEKYSIHAN